MKTALIFTSITELAFNGNANQVLCQAALPAAGRIRAIHLSGVMWASAAVDFPTWLRIGLTNQPRIADLTSSTIDAAQNIVDMVRLLNSGATQKTQAWFDVFREFPTGYEIAWGELANIYAVGWGRNGDKVAFDLRMDVDVV